MKAEEGLTVAPMGDGERRVNKGTEMEMETFAPQQFVMSGIVQ